MEQLEKVNLDTEITKQTKLVKIIVVGDMASGKTSLIKRYVHGLYSVHYKSTIGVDFALKELKWDENLNVSIQLWDVAGQERFGTQANVYFKDARGAIVMFDASRDETKECVKKWRALISEKTRLGNGQFYDPPCILLANKIDLLPLPSAENRVLEPSYMDQLAKEMNFINGLAVSVKDNVGIDDAIKILVRKILEEDVLDKLSGGEAVELVDLGGEGIKNVTKGGCPC